MSSRRSHTLEFFLRQSHLPATELVLGAFTKPLMVLEVGRIPPTPDDGSGDGAERLCSQVSAGSAEAGAAGSDRASGRGACDGGEGPRASDLGEHTHSVLVQQLEKRGLGWGEHTQRGSPGPVLQPFSHPRVPTGGKEVTPPVPGGKTKCFPPSRDVSGCDG